MVKVMRLGLIDQISPPLVGGRTDQVESSALASTSLSSGKIGAGAFFIPRLAQPGWA
jgi:hypothetical protein